MRCVAAHDQLYSVGQKLSGEVLDGRVDQYTLKSSAQMNPP